jgi:hypothetical protein
MILPIEIISANPVSIYQHDVLKIIKFTEKSELNL